MLKKITVLALSVIMVMGLSVSSFALETNSYIESKSSDNAPSYTIVKDGYIIDVYEVGTRATDTYYLYANIRNAENDDLIAAVAITAKSSKGWLDSEWSLKSISADAAFGGGYSGSISDGIVDTNRGRVQVKVDDRSTTTIYVDIDSDNGKATLS